MLLDSNILIYGSQGSEAPLDEILSRTDLAVASVTQIETLGFHRLPEPHRRWFEVAFGRMRILALDELITSRAIALRQARNTGLVDAIIAATALVHNLPLVTRNDADFRGIGDLEIINPFAPD